MAPVPVPTASKMYEGIEAPVRGTSTRELMRVSAVRSWSLSCPRHRLTLLSKYPCQSWLGGMARAVTVNLIFPVASGEISSAIAMSLRGLMIQPSGSGFEGRPVCGSMAKFSTMA